MWADSPKQKTPNPLEPGVSLLCKLGSLVRHVEESVQTPATHAAVFDQTAINALVADHEVIAWLKQMDAKALLPVKRDA